MSRFNTPTLTLNDGREMPQLGFGTYKIADAKAAGAVSMAVSAGYELVDTAAIYENEEGVGQGLEGHDQVWITTKIWNDAQGYTETKQQLADCLHRLGRDEVDLLLIHWPCPDQGLFVDTWKAMIELRDAGSARSIGVSNFRQEDLQQLLEQTGVVPAVNQIELHPFFQQRELQAMHAELGIVTQSWSPLGQGDAIKEEMIERISRETGAPPSAVVLAWHLHKGLAPIPKASSRNHIEDNFAALRIDLATEQMAAIDELDSPEGRIGPDPAGFC